MNSTQSSPKNHATQGSQLTISPNTSFKKGRLISTHNTFKSASFHINSVENPQDQLQKKLSGVFFIKDNRPGRGIVRPSWFGSENRNSSNMLFREPPKPEVSKLRSRPTKQGVAQVEKIMEQVDNKKETLLHFGFKTYEREENRYIKPLIRMVDIEKKKDQLKPTMIVSDLWSETNLTKFLKRQHINKDLYLMKKLMCKKEIQNMREKIKKFTYNNKNTDISKQVYKSIERQPQPSRKKLGSLSQFIHQSQDSLNTMLNSLEEIHDDNLEMHKDVNKKIKQISRHYVD